MFEGLGLCVRIQDSGFRETLKIQGLGFRACTPSGRSKRVGKRSERRDLRYIRIPIAQLKFLNINPVKKSTVPVSNLEALCRKEH